MKIITTIIVLFITVISSNAQCGLSRSSEVLSSFNSMCNNNIINGTINNTIALSASCGDLRFTSPMIDIRDYTGSMNLENPSELSISPNPFNKGVRISLDMEVDDYSITIFNTLGQKILTEKKYRPKESYFIDLSDINPGTYFILFHSENKFRMAQKIIKID